MSDNYRWGVAQTVASAVASAASAAFGDNTRIIRLTPTEDCYVLVGPAPTATSSGHFLAADVSVTMKVAPGEKIAAIRHATTDGTVYISELEGY